MNKRQLAAFAAVKFTQGFLRKSEQIARAEGVSVRDVVYVRADKYLPEIKKAADRDMCPEAPRGLTRPWILLALLALAVSGDDVATEVI
ncbi:MAG: hypothetical protein ABJB03_00860 [Rhodoglobus sp.]